MNKESYDFNTIEMFYELQVFTVDGFFSLYNYQKSKKKRSEEKKSCIDKFTLIEHSLHFLGTE